MLLLLLMLVVTLYAGNDNLMKHSSTIRNNFYKTVSPSASHSFTGFTSAHPSVLIVNFTSLESSLLPPTLG